MKLSISPYVAVLTSFCLVQAAPSAVTYPEIPEALQPEGRAEKLDEHDGVDSAAFTLSKRENKCGHSTFVDQGSGASPWVSDCEQLAFNIRRGGQWTISHHAHRTLATYGTCAFGAEQMGPSFSAFIGNEDIIDLIRDSIRMFRRPDGKVGAKGQMLCSHTGRSGAVAWGLF